MKSGILLALANSVSQAVGRLREGAVKEEVGWHRENIFRNRKKLREESMVIRKGHKIIHKQR